MAKIKRNFNNKSYSGLDVDRPDTLPFGDEYISTDTGTTYRYNAQELPVEVGSGAGGGGDVTTAYLNASQSAQDLVIADKLNVTDFTNKVLEYASTSNGEGASLIGVEDTAGNYVGTTSEEVFAEIATKLTGLVHTAITNIDLIPTANANEYTVEITWTDESGNTQITTDATPLTITPTVVNNTLTSTSTTEAASSNTVKVLKDNLDAEIASTDAEQTAQDLLISTKANKPVASTQGFVATVDATGNDVEYVAPSELSVEDTSIEGIFNNEVAAVFEGYEFRLSQAEGQAQIRVTTGTKAITSFSTYHINDAEGTHARGFHTLDTNWSYVWSDNTLNMSNDGDYERFVWNDGSNFYEARLIVGTGYNNNFIEIKKLGQKSIINTTDLPAAGIANWSDGDFGVWNATSGQFEPAALSQETGTNVTDTLNQTSGTTWSVNTSTSPGDLDFNWNSDFAFYTQEGNKRYYSLRMYLDNDSVIEFGITGAKDVVSVQGIGSSLGSGDFANRACFVKREGVNSVSINRDDNNNVDMFVDITFTAIM